MDGTYYPGSDTKITAHFYLFLCQTGHKEGCVTPDTACPCCGAGIKTCLPGGEKKEAASCN